MVEALDAELGRLFAALDEQRVEDGDLVVDVHDDGAPSVHPAGSSRPDTFGLVGMRERTESLGGRFFAGAAPGGGWLVSARLPVAAGERVRRR